MTPVFLHVMGTGDIWASASVADTPAGTIIATYKFCPDLKFQKLGTLSGTCNSSLAATGATGRNGKEIS